MVRRLSRSSFGGPSMFKIFNDEDLEPEITTRPAVTPPEPKSPPKKRKAKPKGLPKAKPMASEVIFIIIPFLFSIQYFYCRR